MSASWFNMDNAIIATLSGLFVTVVGAWMVKRFVEQNRISERAAPIARKSSSRRSTYRSVHLRIDSDFLKVSFVIFCVIAGSIYFLIQGPNIGGALTSREPGALETQIASLNATVRAPEEQVSDITPPPIAGDPVRINFLAGEDTDVELVSISTRYRLWARAGQTMKLMGEKIPDGLQIFVYDPTGESVLLGDPGMDALPLSGDYTVDVFTATPFYLEFRIYD